MEQRAADGYLKVLSLAEQEAQWLANHRGSRAQPLLEPHRGRTTIVAMYLLSAVAPHG